MRPMPFYFRQLLQSTRRRIVLNEWAQGGLNSWTYQEFYRKNAASWRRVRPDVILLQLGTNDVIPLLEGRYSLRDFETNLDKILVEFGTFRAKNGRRTGLLVSTVPLFSESPASMEKNRLVTSAINPLIRKAAQRAGATVVDTFSVLRGKSELYDPDGVHPNPLGEAAVAKNWLRALRAHFSGADGGSR